MRGFILAQSQNVITTVAGGSLGFRGDGGPASPPWRKHFVCGVRSTER